MTVNYNQKGRGKPPTPNKAHTKKHRRKEVITAVMELYRIERHRDSALEQIKRFEEMSKGSDGGFLHPNHSEPVRKLHYNDWKDNDFKILIREFKKAIKSYHDENNSPTTGDDSDN